MLWRKINLCCNRRVVCKLRYLLGSISMISTSVASTSASAGSSETGSSHSTTSKSLLKLDELMKTSVNAFTGQLDAEEVAKGVTQFDCRQINNVHFTYCRPERVPAPSLLCVSKFCAADIGLAADQFDTPLFLNVFSGNEHGIDESTAAATASTSAPAGTGGSGAGWAKSFATVYGCHSYGHWFGQLGDGRATILGDLVAPSGTNSQAASPASLSKYPYPYPYTENGHFEVQLKGSGRTPFSRWGDGRAVLRSCVREFLASENMHAMRVPTTRALCVLTTGQGIRRAWYGRNNAASVNKSKADQLARKSATSNNKASSPTTASIAGDGLDERFPPNRASVEIGAVMTRITPKTFVRVAQLELFAKREQYEACRKLADFVCEHEYPEVLAGNGSGAGSSIAGDVSASVTALADKYLRLYSAITDRCAYLVTEWMRVGYVQGNMNSDNLLIGGRTIDYGPFGYMEAFDPSYQPFTSDDDGHFSYAEQPTAMHVNMHVLGRFTITYLVEQSIREAWERKHGGKKAGGGSRSSSGDSDGAEVDVDKLVREYKDKVRAVHDEFFFQAFKRHYLAMKCHKLGILSLAGMSVDGSVGGDGDAAAGDAGAVTEATVGRLYAGLLWLMQNSRCDFTIMFRKLSYITALCTLPSSTTDDSKGALSADAIRDCLEIIRTTAAAPDTVLPPADGASSSDEETSVGVARWTVWLQEYAAMLATDRQRLGVADGDSDFNLLLRRVSVQNDHNPRYIMRNWMAALAYEELEEQETARREADYERRAAEGQGGKAPEQSPLSSTANFDGTMCQEMLEVLMDPYDKRKAATGGYSDQYTSRDGIMSSAAVTAGSNEDKYFCITPDWARKLPGVAFMS